MTCSKQGVEVSQRRIHCQKIFEEYFQFLFALDDAQPVQSLTCKCETSSQTLPLASQDSRSVPFIRASPPSRHHPAQEGCPYGSKQSRFPPLKHLIRFPDHPAHNHMRNLLLHPNRRSLLLDIPFDNSSSFLLEVLPSIRIQQLLGNMLKFTHLFFLLYLF